MNTLISRENELEGLVSPVSKAGRFLNFLIDLTLWISVCFCLNTLVDVPDAILTYLIPAGFFLYFFIMEMLFQKTPGKLITRTKVVDLNGGKPTPVMLFVRSLLRFLPFDQVSYLFLQRGIYDYFSSTMVVPDIPDEK